MISWMISTHKIDTPRIFLQASFAWLLVQRVSIVRIDIGTAVNLQSVH